MGLGLPALPMEGFLRTSVGELGAFAFGGRLERVLVELTDQPPSDHRWLGGDIYTPPLPEGEGGIKESWDCPMTNPNLNYSHGMECHD